MKALLRQVVGVPSVGGWGGCAAWTSIAVVGDSSGPDAPLGRPAGSAWKYARCCRPFLAFRPFLDAEQHAAGHDEDHGPHQFLGSARGDARDAGTRTDLLRDSSRDRPGPSATISTLRGTPIAAHLS